MAVASMLAAPIASIAAQAVGRYVVSIGWPRLFLMCLLLCTAAGFFSRTAPPPVCVAWRSIGFTSRNAGTCNSTLKKLQQDCGEFTDVSSPSNKAEVTRLDLAVCNTGRNKAAEGIKSLDEKLSELNMRSADLTERFARDEAAKATLIKTLQEIETNLRIVGLEISNNKMLLLISRFACAMQFSLACKFPTLVKPSGSLSFAALQGKVRRSGSLCDKERFRLIVKEFKSNGILAGEIDDALYELKEVGSEITFPVTLRDANGEIHATIESLSEAIASAAPVDDDLRSLAMCMLPVYLKYRDPNRPLLSCTPADL
eukprot:gene24560-27777_t